MRSFALIIALTTSAMTVAQDLDSIKLGVPQLVGRRVQDVWIAPNGKAVAYTTKTKNGLAIGAFGVDSDEGAIVYTMKDKEVLQQLEWLPSGTRFLLHTSTESGQTNSYTLGVVDVNTLQFKSFWARQLPSGETASLNFFTSPLLDHALIDITMTGKSRETWVLMQNASGFAYSRDIAAAEAQGMSYTGWTQNGTAVYGSPQPTEPVVLQGGNVVLDTPELIQKGAVTLELKLKHAAIIDKVINLSGRWKASPPAPPVGSTVLECVPGNGALRSIKFPGAYLPKGANAPRLRQFDSMQELKLGASSAGTRSLWIVPEGLYTSNPVAPPGPADIQRSTQERKAVPPKGGVLVSAQADGWWSSADNSAVAFTWNGALFVRTVTQGAKN